MKGSWVRELLEACGGLRDGSVAGRSCTEPRPVQVKPLSPTVGRQTTAAATPPAPSNKEEASLCASIPEQDDRWLCVSERERRKTKVGGE